MKQSIVVALDIGTQTIKMALARKNEERNVLEYVSMAEEPSAGVRKGNVIAPKELAKRIEVARNKLETTTSSEITEIIVNLGGSRVFVTSSRGVVAVSRADGHISQEDVDRVLQAAEALSLSPNQEMLDVVLRQYIVDGEEGVQDVMGMQGVRLEAEVLAICVFAPYKNNLGIALLRADLEGLDMVPSPIASARAVLSQSQKELGVALVEIGAGTTGLAVYEEGELTHVATFPVGSNNITSDLAIGLRTEPEIAERVKREIGSAVSPKSKKAYKLQVDDETEMMISPYEVSRIIVPRVREIFNECVNAELKKIHKYGKLPAGVVLTGGGAKLAQITEFAKKELKLPVKLGRISGIEGFPQDLAYATVAGLLRSDAEGESQLRARASGARLRDRFMQLFKVFIP